MTDIARHLSSMVRALTAFTVIACCLVSESKATINDEYYNLDDYLFTDYKSQIRPSSNYTTATQASVQMHLLSIVDLEEQNQVFVTSVILEITYIDQFLTWTPSDYSNISHVIYPQDHVWLPDVVVENSVDSLSQLGYKTQPLTIYSDGVVLWQPSQILRTACDIDISYYPFDTQTCTIILTTWASTKDDIDINLYALEDGFIELDRYSPSGSWELVSTSVQELPTTSDVTRMSFSITIKRLRTWYVMNLLVPVIALSFTASMVFALPADSGEKMGMSITVLLAYAVYLTIISESMPKTSLQVSVIAIYLDLLLVSTAMAVVFSTIVLGLHHQPEEKPVGWRTKTTVLTVRSFLGLSKYKPDSRSDDNRSQASSERTFLSASSDKHQLSPLRRHNKIFVTSSDIGLQDTPTRQGDPETLDDPLTESRPHQQEEEVTWKDVAHTLDRFLFYAFTLFIILNTVGCLGYLALASP